MKNLLLLLTLVPIFSFSQIEGTVLDDDLNEPIYGALIVASTGQKAKSDLDGNFKINPESYPVTLVISAQTYASDTFIVERAGQDVFILAPPVQKVQTVVVSAGRHDQNLEDVSISMEILRPELIDNKGMADLEQAIDQTPGVYAMEGQISIRGGSGYSYGAGSRVLMLWNGMPLLSGYAGDVQWNAIPMENASQVEIMKGASSVLYGSGALNGVVALREREPSREGETRVKIQSGIYDNPKRSTLKWWDKGENPMFFMGDAYYGKMNKNVGYTFSTAGFFNQGYREGETEKRGRVSGSLFYRPKSKERLKAGVGYNLQLQETGNFLIWQSDTFAYTPSGGADTTVEGSTLTINNGTRIMVDPYVKFYDKHNNLHNAKARYYWVQNATGDISQANRAGILFGDYQFQHKWDKGVVLTSGLTGIYSSTKSNLFGDHYSTNYAAYCQYEHRFDKLDLTGGIRFEYFEMDGESGDSDFRFGQQTDTNARSIPVYPVIRLGAHYQLFDYTHLRASFGQGVRYPSVAERHISTSVGALNIFQNPAVTRETGWAAEVGLKQAFKIGDGWKGIMDVSAFINQYDNMIEFAFGVFNPVTGIRIDNDNDAILALYQQGYTINDLIGFRSENAEKARITGAEISFSSLGSIGEVELVSLIGYTYMNPISLNDDPQYRVTFSDSGTNMLKYRFNHLARADIEATYKKFSLGASARYNSFMSNIDAVFEDGVGGTQILPGLKQYRLNPMYNNGNLVFDFRMGYKLVDKYRIGFIINNALNREYEARPGDIQAPRNFILQLQMNL